jgi:hypothetical protein
MHTDWEALSRQLLYEPLGMDSTSSRFADYAARPNKAIAHVKAGNQWVAKYTRQPDAQSPAGGASSNVTDMARWLRLQLGNGRFDGFPLVDAKAIIQTRCPVIVSSPPDTSISRSSFYGLGWGIGYDQTGRVRFSHSGGFSLGAATSVVLLPSENLGIVVLTNGMPIGLPEAVAASFLDWVELGGVRHDWLTMYGKVFAAMDENHSQLKGDKPPENPVPALPNPAYAGKYANGYYGKAQVIATADGLALSLGPKPLEFRLSHWDGNVFAYEPTGESATGISAVTFSVVRGKAKSMTVENLDSNHLGTFSRH